MLLLKEISLDKAKEILDIADKENIFVNSLKDSSKSIFEVVKYFNGKKDFHLFEVINDEISIGFISSFPGKQEGMLSLGVMYILPQHRGKGYGIKMVELFIDYAKSRGFQRVFTKTWSSNIGSNRIFTELGFVETENIPNDRENGDATIKYMKDIS